MREGRPIDARDIDRALARGAEKNRRLAQALDTIATELDRDPGAAARVLRSWMSEAPRGNGGRTS